jgi:hypothetical protein
VFPDGGNPVSSSLQLKHFQTWQLSFSLAHCFTIQMIHPVLMDGVIRKYVSFIHGTAVEWDLKKTKSQTGSNSCRFCPFPTPHTHKGHYAAKSIWM